MPLGMINIRVVAEPPIHLSEQNCYLASRQNMNSVGQGSIAPQTFDLNFAGDMVTESHG